MSNARQIQVVRTLPGSPETVFRALTQADLFARWMGPAGSDVTVKEMDAREGGAFTFEVRIPQGPSFTLTGSYRQLDPPRKLVHTWAMEGDDEETLVTFELVPDGTGTALTLTHTGITDPQDLEQNEVGWAHQLDRLTTLLNELA